MASFNPHDKTAQPGLRLEPINTGTHLIEKRSQDTFASDTLTPTNEKHNVIPRASDVSNLSTPASTHANPFDTDIEAIITTTEPCVRKSTDRARGGTDCQVWPGQDHWRKKAKAAKMKRHNCNCLAHLSKRNRIIVKILIGLLIVGIAVGVGFGVSKPLGAGIWRSDMQSH